MRERKDAPTSERRRIIVVDNRSFSKGTVSDQTPNAEMHEITYTAKAPTTPSTVAVSRENPADS